MQIEDLLFSSKVFCNNPPLPGLQDHASTCLEPRLIITQNQWSTGAWQQ